MCFKISFAHEKVRLHTKEIKKPMIQNADNLQSTAPEKQIIWREPNGSVISCHEKVKVLNENYDELRACMQDVLDDALLLGGSEAQVRQILHQLVDDLPANVAERF